MRNQCAALLTSWRFCDISGQNAHSALHPEYRIGWTRLKLPLRALVKTNPDASSTHGRLVDDKICKFYNIKQANYVRNTTFYHLGS